MGKIPYDKNIVRKYLAAYSWSFKVLPLQPGAKVPAARGWSDPTYKADTDALIDNECGVGIITGKQSGITVVDIDVIDSNGTPGVDPSIFPPTLTIRTPSGGFHKYYEYDERIHQTQSSFKAFPKVDIRNDGGFVVAPPTHITYTKTFDDGVTKEVSGSYEVVSGGDLLVDGILGIAPFPSGLFLPFYNVLPTEEEEKINKAVRTRVVNAERPGDDFEANTSWEELLSPAGFKKTGMTARGDTRWTRPGKAGNDTSAVVRMCEDGRERFFVFSTNAAPFEPYQKGSHNSYNKISTYALLSHNGDFSAAISALREKGYGNSVADSTGYIFEFDVDEDAPSMYLPEQPAVPAAEEVRTLEAPVDVPPPQEATQSVEITPPAEVTPPQEKGAKNATIPSVIPHPTVEQNKPRHRRTLRVSVHDKEVLDKLEDNDSLVGIRCLRDIKEEPIDWLWKGKLAIGELSILSGEPGTGKTMAALDVAARVTRGAPVPYGMAGDLMNNGFPGDVLVLTSENDPAKVLKPRLVAAGAAMDRVHLIESSITKKVKGKLIKKHVALAEDSEKIGEAVGRLPDDHAPVLLIIDPISEYMGGKDQNNNSDVRDLLATLTEHLRHRDVAILAISHLNKKTEIGSATSRINGSVGFAGAARTVFTATRYQNPEWNDEQREEYRDVMAFTNAKNNLSGDKGGCTYRIIGYQYETEDGLVIETARIEWLEEIEESADEMLANSHRGGGSSQGPDERERCASWLERYLAQHPEGVKRADVINAALHEGFTNNTVNKAVGTLIVSKEGGIWKLIKPFV